LDLESLRLMPGSFVDDELRSRHTDLLFSVTFRGRPALIYVLFEHQRHSS
jgi:predicted transposase YdaD